MIQVNLKELNLEEQVRNDLEAARDKVRKLADIQQKYEYIDSHDEFWRNTLGSLAQLTGNTVDNCKCWYCECDGSAGFYFQVDHYRPKKRVRNKGYKKGQYEPGYWWLAFDSDNYRVACQRCNTGAGKRDQFPLPEDSPRAIVENGHKSETPLLLDPNSGDPRLLRFLQNGDVKAAVGCLEFEKRKVDTSISVYNLRARSKREGRRKIWEECRDAIIDARQVRDQLIDAIFMNSLAKATFEAQFSKLCAKISSMKSPNAKFSSTAKACIKDYYKVESASAEMENREPDLEWLWDLL